MQPDINEEDLPYYIKVFGVASADFKQAVQLIIAEYFPDLAEEDIHANPSGNGKYLAITVKVMAGEGIKETVEACYKALRANPQVLMVM